MLYNHAFNTIGVTFRQNFASQDEVHKEEIRRERRRFVQNVFVDQ